MRRQNDGLQEFYSQESSLDCSDMPDMTRQEFKDETDVNKVLARYGIDGLPRKPEFSEVDYDMDLQQSLESIREAERAIQKLPTALRDKYSTWERLLAGAYGGQFKTDLAAHYAAEKAAQDAAAAAVPTKIEG